MVEGHYVGQGPYDLSAGTGIIAPAAKVAQAARLFLTGAAVAFLFTAVVGAMAPSAALEFFGALRDIYGLPVDLVGRYVSIYVAIVVANAVAAAVSAGLGTAGAALLSRLHERDQQREVDYGLSGRASYSVAAAWCWLGSLAAPRISTIADFGARSSVAISALAPRLSLLATGAVLGLHAAAALIERWIGGVVELATQIAPHGLLEFPAIALSAGIGLAAADELINRAHEGPRAVRERALGILTSRAFRRTLAVVGALIVIGAAVEVRGLA